MDYRKVQTSPEVCAVIRAKHRELKVFSSFSDPCCDFNGGPGERGRMETAYGFDGSAVPVIEARTTWDIDPECDYKRFNEAHEYWLCYPVEEL